MLEELICRGRRLVQGGGAGRRAAFLVIGDLNINNLDGPMYASEHPRSQLGSAVLSLKQLAGAMQRHGDVGWCSGEI